MSSFSISKAMNPETLEDIFSKITLGDRYKDYRKHTYPVNWESGKYLSLKLPEMTILQTPKEGDKFICAGFSKKELCNSRNFLKQLDLHLACLFPDSEHVKPGFDKVIKLYIPYKDGKISYRKFNIYDSAKNEVELQELKENTKIKALVYLRQYKKYFDEIIPVWAVGQIQALPSEAPEPLVPDDTKESEEIDQNIQENHSNLDSRPKILLEETQDESDFSEGEFSS